MTCVFGSSVVSTAGLAHFAEALVPLNLRALATASLDVVPQDVGVFELGLVGGAALLRLAGEVRRRTDRANVLLDGVGASYSAESTRSNR